MKTVEREKKHLSLQTECNTFILDSCNRSDQNPSSNKANTPNPTEMSLVETAQALLIQTKQIEASPTPIPAITHTPAPQVSLAGTSLIFREDKTTEFVDHRAGIKLIIPVGWLPVRPNEDEFYKAFTLDVVQENPEIADRLAHIQSLNTDYFRLDAIDMRDGHIQDGILTVINVIFEEGDTRSLEKWAEAERNKKQPFANFKFISSSYPETANGTRVLFIEQTWASGKSDTIYYRGVFFSLPTGTIVLDFYTNDTFKETVIPDFEEVVNSLTLLDPVYITLFYYPLNPKPWEAIQPITGLKNECNLYFQRETCCEKQRHI